MKKTIQEIEQYFDDPNYWLDRKELAVLQGMVSGDGDIGGRMASSVPSDRSDNYENLQQIADLHKKFGTPFDLLAKIHTPRKPE